jgi:polar amino acid transport system substrate-binding protein
MGHQRLGFDHPQPVSGNYDTIIAGMSITDERDEVIDFTQNYTPPASVAYVAACPRMST